MIELVDITKSHTMGAESIPPSATATIRRDKIGFVFQSVNLIPRTEAVADVESPLVYAGTRSRRSRAVAALERVGPGDRIHHLPSELSGGQKQRVAIARALINDPAIILADEPTGALDTTSTTEILELPAELNALGRTIVVITHEDEVADYRGRTVRLRDGVIGSDEPHRHPRAPFPRNVDARVPAIDHHRVGESA